MAPKIDNDGTVYIPFRAPWELIEECRFHMKDQKIRFLGAYVRLALIAYNKQMEPLPSKLTPNEKV